MKFKFGSLFFLVMGLLPFVSAQSAGNFFSDVRFFFSDLYDNLVEPLARFLLGSNLTGDQFFGKILMFILIFIIIWLSVSGFPLFKGKKGMTLTVSLVVSVLSTRFIASPELVEAILLPYSALGITVSVFLPFVLMFFFSFFVVRNNYLRKMSWLLFFAVLIGLYFVRYEELGDLAWAYAAFAVLALIMSFSSKWVDRILRRVGDERLREAYNLRRQRTIRREIHQLEEDHNNGIVSDADYERLRGKLEKDLARHY